MLKLKTNHQSLTTVIDNLRSGQSLLGENYALLNSQITPKVVNAQTQVDNIVRSLRLGLPLSGSDYVALCEYSDDIQMGFAVKKHFITMQAAVSIVMRSHIMKDKKIAPYLALTGLHPHLNTLNSMYLNKKIRLLFMYKERALKVGDCGVVNHIDDAGQVHVNWDQDRKLAVMFDAGDQIEIVE